MDVVLSPVDGIPVAFRVSGSGPSAVVFIHGLSGDHTHFAAQIDHFGAAWQVVAIDLPGAGASGRDRSTWAMEALGADVAAVVDHLGLSRVVLVGHSLGGNVTVEAALRLTGRTKALVWVSSFRSLRARTSDSHLEQWFAPFDVDFAAAMDHLTRRNFGPNADPALVDSIAMKARRADETRTIGLLRSKFAHHAAVTKALARIEAPVFAINSDFKPNDEASFVRRGVELRIIPGVGHFVMVEDPAGFNSELDDILTRLDLFGS